MLALRCLLPLKSCALQSLGTAAVVDMAWECAVAPVILEVCRALAADVGADLWSVHAQVLAAEIQGAGGVVTAQDLEQAQPNIKRPITTKVRNSCLASPAL